MKTWVPSLLFCLGACASIPFGWSQEPLSITQTYSDQDLAIDHSLPGAMVIDRVVAVVGDRVLTVYDLRLEAAIEARDPSPVPLIRSLPGDSLQALVDQALIRQEAGNITVYQPSASEVRARLNLLRASWTDPREYDRFLEGLRITEEQLEGVLFSTMVIENLVHRQVILASIGKNEEPDELRLRYEAWLTKIEQKIPYRIVPPMSEAKAP